MYILSIDQGTTGSTVSLVNEMGKIVCSHNEEFPQIFPKPGWVEHNPEDIWKSVLSGIKAVNKKANLKPGSIKAIGITNQRETVVAWDRVTGQSIHNAIVWQCRRTTEFCQKLKKRGLQKNIKNKTGLVIDPYFSASKMNWILSNVPNATKKMQSGDLAFGTIDSFLIYKLTGGKSHVTDVSNASRTMLLNIKAAKWDDELVKIFKVNKKSLPEVLDSNALFGKTHKVPGLENNIPITGVLGDQQAALFGQTCFNEAEAKCTFGTGSFILMNIGAKKRSSRSGLLTTVAWKLSSDKSLTYAFEGGAFICGAAVQWLRDGLEFFKSAPEIEKLARQVEDTDGVEFVPALSGLGAPYWDPDARGLICGLTRGTTKAHIARATLEAMALQNADILKAMEKDAQTKMKKLRVDGGASNNNLLMQLQANYLGQNIIRPEMIETTSLGAAYMAGLGAGVWKNLNEIKKVWNIDKEFKKHMSEPQRKERLKSWHRAIDRARFQA